MTEVIVKHLGIKTDDTVVDYGCARGYTVKALRMLYYKGYGVDISKWAIENCDTDVVEYVKLSPVLTTNYDWVIAKDVLEHVPNVRQCVKHLMEKTNKGLFVVVPLSFIDGQPYIVASYEKDITHLHRFTLATWAEMFMVPGWTVEASYRVIGVKDNYAKPKWEAGNGFLTCRRQFMRTV